MGSSHLLRGVIDAGDYKQFIFPLLFFKRICDVYDEEFQRALDESEGDVTYASFAENHRFQIPEGADWHDVRNQTSNIGFSIQIAMREIEQANPNQLYGIFGDAQWTNKDRLSDAILRDLIEHFSSLILSVANVPEDELGQAYEYLIKKFADDSGHTAAEFYTNRTLVHLMTLMLDPQPGESIYDPTCGSGGMLLSTVAELKRQGKEYRTLKLYGQERNLITSAIARMNLFLHGIEDFQIERGDTLAEPKFIEGDHLRRFDIVLANPPYSIKQWNRSSWESDPYGRNIYGVPPQGRADYAFFQHIIASMNPHSGRCAILFPHGVLFRDEEQSMRTRLIADDKLECVLGLGPNLFYNSSMAACIVMCRMNKSRERKGKVLFIDAVHEIVRERTQSYLTDKHIKKIMQAYHAFQDIEGFARVVSKDEILSNQANLNIPLYIRSVGNGSKAAMNEEMSLTHTIHTKPEIPEGWIKVRFDALADNIVEHVEVPSESGYDRFVGGDHLDSGSLKISRWGSTNDVEAQKLLFKKGHRLFGKRNAYLRKVAYVDFDGVCSAHMLVLKAKPDYVLEEFLPFFMQTDQFWERALMISEGSMSPTIKWKTLAQQEFLIPPKDEQRQIADILWAVDDTHIKWERVLQESIALRNSLIDNYISYNQEFPDLPSYDNKEYQIVKLQEVCARITDGTHLPPQFAPRGIPFLLVSNLTSGKVGWNVSKWISEETYKELTKRVKPEVGDVLYTVVGSFGIPVLITWDIPFAFQRHIAILKPKRDLLDGSYLTYFLESNLGKKQAELTAVGNAQRTITLGSLNNFKLPLPPLNKQKQIVRRLDRVNNTIAAASQHIQVSKQLKGEVLKQLMAGR